MNWSWNCGENRKILAESASLISEHNIDYSHADINTANFEIIDKKNKI